MRRKSLVLTVVISFLALVASPIGVHAQSGLRRGPAPVMEDFVPGDVLVRFRPEAAGKVDELGSKYGLVREERIAGIGIERMRLPAGGDVLDTIRRLRNDPNVLVAEPNYVARLCLTPNDTLYAGVDGFANDLQKWTFAGADSDPGIRAESAWDLTTGRPDVTIAVIDSGVMLTHPDLAPNLWTNPGEIAGNGADDDANGFIDDVHGWDFYASDGDPNPDLGNGINDDGFGIGDDNTYHGTFAANLAAGRGNDGRGVCGTSWQCSVMAIKIFTDDGVANTFHIAEALEYAADNGADVINMSLETRSSNTTLQEGVAYAIARDCIVVAAAGNDGFSSAVYPAGYSGVLSVGGSGHAFGSPAVQGFFGPPRPLGRPNFSNYGPVAVDVVAPSIVFSSSVASVTDANDNPGLEAGDVISFTSSGTSFSCPIVAGEAGLVLSRDRDLNGGVRTLSNAQVIEIIEGHTQNLPDDTFDSPNGGETWDNKGRVDVRGAVEAVTGTGGGDRSVKLTWQTPDGSELAAPTGLMAEDLSAGKLLTVNESEPNNSTATAQTIVTPETVNGQIATSDEGPVKIVYEDTTEDVVEDLFKFTLATEKSLNVRLTPNGASDLDLALLTDIDGNGEFTFEPEYLAANPATGPQQTEGLTNVVLPAGTYYVACTIYDGAPIVNSDGYTLSITNGAPIVEGYRIYRQTSAGVDVSIENRIAQVSGVQLTFTDTSAPDGDVFYVVTAVYSGGESGPSNEAGTGDVDPNAPVVINPVYKKGKLTLTAAGSKIVTGSVLIVGNIESFALKSAKGGSVWVVKKNVRSTPGGLRISEALPFGQDVTLTILTPTGLRSAPVTFRRQS